MTSVYLKGACSASLKASFEVVVDLFWAQSRFPTGYIAYSHGRFNRFLGAFTSESEIYFLCLFWMIIEICHVFQCLGDENAREKNN
jgi:hypothetical protein